MIVEWPQNELITDCKNYIRILSQIPRQKIADPPPLCYLGETNAFFKILFWNYSLTLERVFTLIFFNHYSARRGKFPIFCPNFSFSHFFSFTSISLSLFYFILQRSKVNVERCPFNVERCGNMFAGLPLRYSSRVFLNGNCIFQR